MAPRSNDRRTSRPKTFALRVATARGRILPSFFLVGAMKSGTSSLFSHLCGHGRILRPYRKETHYFDIGRRAGKTLNWYRAHFPLRTVAGSNAITGEATPDYSFEPGIAEEIKALNPDARIIFILRNPIDRAISHYFHEVRMGRETLPIEKAFALEKERLAAAVEAGEAGVETLSHAAYFGRGQYYPQVARYISLFGRENVLVCGSRELFDEPGGCVAKVVDFLNLPQEPARKTYPVRNKGGTRDDVPPSLRDRLARDFVPHNERLRELLGRRLDW